MLVLGLSGGAELIFRGKTARGIGTIVFFCSIPIVVWIFQEVKIPWSLVAPMILIGIGVIVLVKAFFLRGE